MHLPGTKPKDYLRELYRNPDILAKNIEQASQFSFGGMAKSWVPRLKELVAAGNSYGEMAKILGVSRSAIAGAVRDAGLTGQGNAPVKRLSDEAARAYEKSHGRSRNLYRPRRPSKYVEDTAGVDTTASEWVTLPDGTLQRLYTGK